MRLLSQRAVVKCGHDGFVATQPSQHYVTIGGVPILVEADPEGRGIAACPNIGVHAKPCTNTLTVRVGYSQLLRISGHRVCLDSVVGFTDGTPPGTVDYTVRDPGQQLVGSTS